MDKGLFLLLLISHWAGDYTHLSRPRMLAAKKLGTPLMPILEHAGVHAILCGVIVFWWSDSWLNASVAFAIQLATHFVIDVLKGKANKWFPSLQNPANYFHWWIFGIDQTLHIAVLVSITSICQST